MVEKTVGQRFVEWSGCEEIVVEKECKHIDIYR